jgi:hypothetical protein
VVQRNRVYYKVYGVLGLVMYSLLLNSGSRQDSTF